MTYYFSDSPYKEWMTNLPATLTALPLNNLALPGTHDSFTYPITSSSSVSPDCEDVVKKLISIFGFLAKPIVARWAKAQEMNTFAQLESGIRYLDIRVAKNAKKKDEIYSCHSLFGNSIQTDLLSVKDFLSIHPKEVVLLDINHFYAFGVDEHFRLLRLLETIFGNLLTPYQYAVPSLDDLWKTSHRVFVFYHSNYVSQPYLWPGYYIPSPWPDVDTMPKLLEYLTTNYIEGRENEHFHVSQGVLTPTTKTIVTNFYSSLKAYLAAKATPGFIQWVSDKDAGKGKINCSIVDFSENPDYVPILMQLNMKLAGDMNGLMESLKK